MFILFLIDLELVLTRSTLLSCFSAQEHLQGALLRTSELFDSYSFCNFIFSFEIRSFHSIGVGTSYSGSEVPIELIFAKNFSSFAGSPIHPPSRHHQDPFNWY